MSPRKKVVEHLAACFSRQDWAGMLPMVTEDFERWEVGAPTRTHGKKEFLKEMEPGPDVTKLQNDIARMFEDGNVVVAEGTVQVFLKDGKVIHVRYCNVYEFEGEQVQRLTAYTNVV